MAKDSKKTTEDTEDVLKDAQETMKDVGDAIENAEEELSLLDESIRKINELIKSINKNMETVQEDLLGFQTTVQEEITQAFDQLVEHTQAWRTITEEAIDKGKEYWDQIKETSKTKYEEITGAAQEDYAFLGDSWKNIKEIFGGEGNIFTKGKAVVSQVQDVVKKAKEWVTRYNEIKEFGINTWKAVKKDALETWEKITETFGGDKTWGKEAWNKIKTAAKWEDGENTGWKGQIDKFVAIGKGIWEVAKETGKGVWDGSTEMLKGDYESATSAWGKVKDVFKGGGSIFSKGKDAISAVKDTIGRGKDWKERVDNVKKMGGEGWDGLKTTGEETWSQASEKAKGAWDSVKGTWGNLKKVFSRNKEEEEENALDAVTDNSLSETITGASEKAENLQGNLSTEEAGVMAQSSDVIAGEAKQAGVTLSFGSLVENIQVSGNKLSESVSEIQDQVVEALINALKIAHVQTQ